MLISGAFAVDISIHALREEGDRKYFRIRSVSTYFYPRPPRGGRPLNSGRTPKSFCRFLSTPSARRATAYGLNMLDVNQISIHALREEGDHYDSRREV